MITKRWLSLKQDFSYNWMSSYNKKEEELTGFFFQTQVGQLATYIQEAGSRENVVIKLKLKRSDKAGTHI